jgi:rhodanese-related sulfurtransferase
MPKPLPTQPGELGLVTVVEWEAWRTGIEPPILLDVREDEERELACFPGSVVIVPMSRLGEEGPAALPKEITETILPIVVGCHHGIRSHRVAGWLISLGHQQVYNLVGGIDAYAREVAPAVGRY